MQTDEENQVPLIAQRHARIANCMNNLNRVYQLFLVAFIICGIVFLTSEWSGDCHNIFNPLLMYLMCISVLIIIYDSCPFSDPGYEELIKKICVLFVSIGVVMGVIAWVIDYKNNCAITHTSELIGVWYGVSTVYGILWLIGCIL
jgi:hypothetical protein